MKITVKNTWKEVTLAEFMAVSNIEEDQSLVGRPLARGVKLIEILSSATEDEILQVDGDTLTKLLNQVKFLAQKPKPTRAKTIKIDGVEYGYENGENITAGEMISIESLLQEGADNNKSTMDRQLAILIRPMVDGKIEPFKLEGLEAREELFLDNLKVPFFFGLLVNSLPTEKK